MICTAVRSCIHVLELLLRQRNGQNPTNLLSNFLLLLSFLMSLSSMKEVQHFIDSLKADFEQHGCNITYSNDLSRRFFSTYYF